MSVCMIADLSAAYAWSRKLTLVLIGCRESGVAGATALKTDATVGPSSSLRARGPGRGHRPGRAGASGGLVMESYIPEPAPSLRRQSTAWRRRNSAALRDPERRWGCRRQRVE